MKNSLKSFDGEASPDGNHLFIVREDGERKLLPEDQASKFHRIVAQLLFICKRVRPNIEPLILLLTTRVKETDEENWGKLKNGLMYLKCTLYMKR